MLSIKRLWFIILARKGISIVATRVRWQTEIDKRCVCSLFSMWKAAEMLSIKRERFAILARKGISIVARVRLQK